MTKLEEWNFDNSHSYFCPFCGAEAYELTYTRHICFKCKRVFERPTYIGRI
jgi:ribosomal protein L37AE/L43A